MEANIKENQITFSKGMSNVPSDNLCDDNSLSDCIGLRMKDGELRAVQRAKEYGTLDGELLFVHKTNAYAHLIYNKDGTLYWAEGDEDDITSADNPIGISISSSVTLSSIGNLLIVNDAGKDIQYCRWNNGDYEVLGSLPHINAEVYSDIAADSTEQVRGTVSDTDEKAPWGSVDLWDMDARPSTDKEHDNIVNNLLYKGGGSDATANRRQYEDEVIGLISAGDKAAARSRKFTYPFWLRFGIELYDGSVSRLTCPILVLPTVRCGAYVVMTDIEYFNGKHYTITANHAVGINVRLSLDGVLDGLEDIVKDIAVYMSEPVKTYEDTNMSGREGRDYSEPDSQDMDILFDWIDKDGGYHYAVCTTSDGGIKSAEMDIDVGRYTFTGKNDVHYWISMPPYSKSDDEIKKELIKHSVFYRVGKISIDEASTGKELSLGSIIEPYVLENLTTQQQLEHDDYYGNCTVHSQQALSFNGRLNLSNIKRTPFIGFSSLMQRYKKDLHGATLYYETYIRTSAGLLKTERRSVDSPMQGMPPLYFFYPDPRAFLVKFSDASGKELGCKKLEQHPRLNGAYYFIGLPRPSDSNYYKGVRAASAGYFDDVAVPRGQQAGAETLPSTIMTSEVNNPWVFNAEGDNTVGTGWIVGMVSNTRALSQGQFGQHPLIVFTSEGIYALGTNSEGLYSTNYPLSREVCNNPKSITPTDGAVFFTSEKGLMMMVGSEIACVSQQMMGKTDAYSPDSLYSPDSPDSQESGHGYGKEAVNLHDFLKDCVIAYDYRDYCLYLINTAFTYHYVYDIKSGAITRQDAPTSQYQRVVNDYPDNLLQDSDGTVWSLINKPEPNADDTNYSGILLSRPCKMGDAQTLKSLRRVLHVMDLHDGASVKLHVYVSNDLQHWGEIKSLKGCGWKYFRFGLAFSNLKATDSYSGLLAITQNRRTDKLR